MTRQTPNVGESYMNRYYGLTEEELQKENERISRLVAPGGALYSTETYRLKKL